MSSEPTAHTAYTGRKARQYDAQRFTTQAGRNIGDNEALMVRCALSGIAPGSRVLEVGCGTGRLLLQAKAAGFHVVGLDASPDMLDEARNKFAAAGVQAGFHLAEAARLPFNDGSFDCSYSVRLLNQTESPAYACAVIREMIRVTRPGGRILIEFVNAWRPRLTKAGHEPVRLAPAQVIETARAAGAELVWMKGLFFLGMTASLRAPSPLVPLIAWLDGLLSRLLPRFCARGYGLFEKRS